MRFSLFVSGLLAGWPLLACGQHPQAARPAAIPATLAPTAGVSRALAQERRQRLSRVAYQLDFTIPASKDTPIELSETVTFRLRDAARPVLLDFKAPAGRLRLLAVNGRPTPPDLRNEHLVLPAAALRPGDNVVQLALDAGEQSLNRNADYLYTLLVPDRARTVFPCFDQPDLKAVFTVNLTVPRDWQTLANARPAGHDERNDSKTLHYRPTDSLSTYLFTVVAGKFQRTFEAVDGRTLALLHRETDTAKIRLSVPELFQQHGQALAFLEKYTGRPYPFAKLDFAAIPDFQYGGMEHAGAIDYKQSTLFLDQGATKDQLLARQNLIGHEVAHQWFGDLVTMRWFDDVWMKEVFANFMADKLSATTEDSVGQRLKFLTEHLPAAYAVDRTAGANPIRQPLDNLQDAGTLYGNIIYHKAPVMLRQLELLMGPAAFRAGVQEYLAQYAGGNADWPDLIRILDAHTPEDLVAWNETWVNQPGQPAIEYELHTSSDRARPSLLLFQQGEDGSQRFWPQQFEVLLTYAGGKTERRQVRLTDNPVTLTLPYVPHSILLNSNGLGYGVFSLTPLRSLSDNWQPDLDALTDPVARASAYINLYENMLRGQSTTPRQLLAAYQTQLAHETQELNLKLLTGYLSNIFWQFTKPVERATLAPALEEALWQALLAAPTPGAQKLLFQAYQRVALTPAAQARLYQVWQAQQPPAQVKLTEEDYTSLALALAVRDYPAPQPILPAQLARVSNPDRRQRLEFLLPALSPDAAVRDQFFASLKQEKNREKEAWVATALGYLHHPLRQATSEKYLPASLDLLAEIQLTGDIFFPVNWLQATLGQYQSPTAARTVRQFLAAHPKYNPRLRAKILQAADDLFRAEKLTK